RTEHERPRPFRAGASHATSPGSADSTCLLLSANRVTASSAYPRDRNKPRPAGCHVRAEAGAPGSPAVADPTRVPASTSPSDRYRRRWPRLAPRPLPPARWNSVGPAAESPGRTGSPFRGAAYFPEWPGTTAPSTVPPTAPSAADVKVAKPGAAGGSWDD